MTDAKTLQGSPDPVPTDNEPPANLVQMASIRFGENSAQRTSLRTARPEILTADMQKSHLILRPTDVSQQTAEVPLFGRRVTKMQVSRSNGDAEPSFASNCICIRTVPDRGVIVGFPSAAAMENWCNSFCFAGCVMRDLEDQVHVTANLGEIRLVSPKTARMEAELLALKASTEPEKKKMLMNEAYFLLMLDNPGIPRAHGIYDIKILGEPGLAMVLDYKAGSDLSTWIPSGGFPEWAMKGIMVQIRDVLLYLHGRSIVHRDIKPSNVFCERGDDGSMKVCLADFGLAARADERDTIAQRCGSPGYIAPEIFEANWTERPEVPTDEALKVDMFSFGMLIYEAGLGENPFTGETLRQIYRNNWRGIIAADEASRLSLELQDLLNLLTARNPRNRCSIFDAAGHPWFQADLRALGFAGADDALRGDSVSWEVFQQESRRRQE